MWWREALKLTAQAFAIAVALSAIGCGKSDSGQPAPAGRPGAIVISGDTGPWIVPCGCTANQAGGLLRRATYLNSLRPTRDVIYADVGGAAAGTTAYFKEKFHAVLRGEVAMNIAAHNLGKAELALGPGELQAAAKATHAPFVSANARSSKDGQLLAPAMKVIPLGSRRVALVGVVSPRYATADVRVDEPRLAITSALQQARGTYDSAIVLAYLPDEELQQLAAALPEADAVIGGPTGQAQVPHNIGPVIVGAATNKGKFLIQLDSSPAAGVPWKGQIVEMAATIADDASQKANLNQYLQNLAELDFPAGETGLMTPIDHAPESYRVAGSQSCVTCHATESATWQKSAHAHAGATLSKNGPFNADPYCLQCHTTNFGMPGGFVSPKRTPALAVVGCESCHGPSQAHVDRPAIRTTFNAFDQCVRCHDHENSPAFEKTAYWAKIQHGKKFAPTTQAAVVQ